MNNTTKGNMQTMAKALKPAVTNSYIANKNRRKSNNTLPLFSDVYADMLFVITWRDCSPQLSDPSARFYTRSY